MRRWIRPLDAEAWVARNGGALRPPLPAGAIAYVSIHGRSRQGRYSKTANWEYIGRCARTLYHDQNHEPAPASGDGARFDRDAAGFGDLPPVLGNGDVLSFTDWEGRMAAGGGHLAGAMIGRGALIKPWLMTEIKARLLILRVYLCQ